MRFEVDLLDLTPMASAMEALLDEAVFGVVWVVSGRLFSGLLALAGSPRE
jgi:hypothetical protein